jgi:thiol-disulfide isomerase/thioredoxin
MGSVPPGEQRPAGYLGITRRPNRKEWRRALTLFVVGMIGLTLMLLFIHPQPSLLAVGSNAPALTLTSSSGGSVALPAAAGGQPYVVEFFEAGCAHCQQVAGQLCGVKAPVFAIDAAKESADTVNVYHRQYASGCAYPTLLDPTLSTTSAYAVSAVPTVYVVKGGKIVFSGAGLEGIAALDGAVRQAIGG